MMWRAEVIDTAQEKDGRMNSLGGARQSARATGKTVNALTKGGIEAFNVGGVDDAALLGERQQACEQSLCPLHDAPFNREGSSLTMLDDLVMSRCGQASKRGRPR